MPNLQNTSMDTENHDAQVLRRKSPEDKVILVISLVALAVFISIVVFLLCEWYRGKLRNSQLSVNFMAESLADCFIKAVCEMDSEGHYVEYSTFIISSDPSMNVNAPPNCDLLYEKANHYYYYVDQLTYFVVFDKYNVIYVACMENRDQKFIGTYPTPTKVTEGPMTYTNSVGEKDWKFEDLYLYTRNELFGN